MSRHTANRAEIGSEMPVAVREKDFALTVARFRELVAMGENLEQYADVRTAGLRRPEPPAGISKSGGPVSETRAPIAGELLLHAISLEIVFNRIRDILDQLEI